jgi:ubiquitin thioesterase protein OTUB1
VGYRSVKKDGNCFFRAFGFRFAELIWTSHDAKWKAQAMKNALGTKTFLISTGYDEGAVEDFYDTFVEMVTQTDKRNLVEMFQGYASDTAVCFLRLCTAAELKKNRELYEAFAEMPLDDFISQLVEPMYVEVLFCSPGEVLTGTRRTIYKSVQW